MEKSFDFGTLLKTYAKKHKSKPAQFVSVSNGVQKRLETNLKHRKSSRLTVFDSIRNLSQSSPCNTPIKKMEHRRQQLEKWKEEKAKKKKEEAAQKKKPFITGVPHNSLRFVPPPPAPKTAPSTSRRVTRSQAARLNKPKLNQIKEPKESQKSFAPKNAPFHAPQMKHLTKMPNLAPTKSKKDQKAPTIMFEPVLPSAAQTEVRSTRARTYIELNADSKISRSTTAKGKVSKPVSKVPIMQLSSSSSELEPSQIKNSSASDTDLTNNMPSSSSDTDLTAAHCLLTEKDSAKSLHSSSSTESEMENKQLLILIKPTKQSAKKPKAHRKSRTPRKLARVSIPLEEMEAHDSRKSVPKSESSSEERLRSPKSPEQSPLTPKQIVEEAKKMSPNVTVSRGKENARKEMLHKLKEGLLDEDCYELDDIGHFRRQLASEIERLTEMCDTWDKISEQVALPDSVQELVLGAVGQARLLMSQKMQQFATLVERCARPEPGAALVTPADLLGFWDMVFMQVVNVDMRFKKLEELKSREWVEEQPAVLRPRPASKPASKPVAKPRVAAAPSRLKEMIAAARQAKKQTLQSPRDDDNTFEAGFFCVRSPVRSPRSPSTPAKGHNLLKAVLSSEAKKASNSKINASFAMLRASVLGKNLECEGVAPLPLTPLAQVNLSATPGRSILKQARDSSKKHNKSIKVVLFNQSDDGTHDSSSTENMRDKDASQKDKAQTEILGDSLMEAENDSGQRTEYSRRTSQLVRQDAVTVDVYSPVRTRSRRTGVQTPQTDTTPKRSARKKVLDEADVSAVEEKQKTPLIKKTPRKSARKLKVLEQVATNVEDNPESLETNQSSKRRASKKKILEKIEIEEEMRTSEKTRSARRKTITEEVEIKENEEKHKTPQIEKTPKKSARKKKVLDEANVVEENQEHLQTEKTPKKSGRKKKVLDDDVEINVMDVKQKPPQAEKTPKKSDCKVLEEVVMNLMGEMKESLQTNQPSKRSARKKKVVEEMEIEEEIQKTPQTSEKTRSARRKTVFEEVEINREDKTPKRSTIKLKSLA